MIFGVIIILCVLMADFTSYTTIQDYGIITSKEYEPQSTSYYPQVVGKLTILLPRTEPEKFILLLHTENSGHVSVEVSHSLYDKAEIGKRVKYVYNKGKVAGSVSAERITLLGD